MELIRGKMYEYISGRLVELNPAAAVIDCGGIGYRILISLTTFTKLNDSGNESVKLFLHHLVREDDESLYGFFDKQERQLFLQLISVSGVGASTACAILSSLSAEELRDAIISQNVNKIKSVKGIGLKTAQRLILELKDKVGTTTGESLDFLAAGASSASPVRQEASSALVLLGFPKPNVEKALDILFKEKSDWTIEELIKKALKTL